MEALSGEDVKAAFGPNDELWLPAFEDIEWNHRDFLSWIHPSGHLGYIVTRPQRRELAWGGIEAP